MEISDKPIKYWRKYGNAVETSSGVRMIAFVNYADNLKISKGHLQYKGDYSDLGEPYLSEIKAAELKYGIDWRAF